MTVCFLPFRGELGWYLTSFVNMVHGSAGPKVVCIKRGHECLFPSAMAFFYNWKDIPDDHKAGVITTNDEEVIKEEIRLSFPTENLQFVSHTVITWANKHSFYQNSFVPKPRNDFGLKVDLVITPRQRVIDSSRNWPCPDWQTVIDTVVSKGFTVGVCGTSNTSCKLQNILHKSYDYVDIDSDVEMMSKAKLVLTQESGLQYLSFMCKRPTFCLDHYHRDHGADLYRDPAIPFSELISINHDPIRIAQEAINFLESQK